MTERCAGMLLAQRNRCDGARLISEDKPSQEAALNKLINATLQIRVVLVSFVLYCVISDQYSNKGFASLNV